MKKRRQFIKNSILGTAAISMGDVSFNSFPHFHIAKHTSFTYSLLTTCPPYGSQNVGDKPIEQRTKELIQKEKGDVNILTIFREENLEPFLDQINSSRALLLPAFPIRDTPMYPGVYRLIDNLSKIKVPMIPIGANWNTYPGDEESRNTLLYSKETIDFLTYINNQVEVISCREYYTIDILRKHNFNNTIMTGDPAWFLIPRSEEHTSELQSRE